MSVDTELLNINWSEPFEMAVPISVESIPQECMQCLRRCFGHTRFREMQWKIISSILDSGRDNCVVMATGYGKSLCYQFPSVYRDTITIVVSPLISLMQDQVVALRFYNLRACFLGSAQMNRETENEVIEGQYNIVYVTPEYITGECGTYLLQRIREKLTLIAIDEAHCISKWGHDFRSAYRNLSQLRSACPSVPFLAMTATATAQVLGDIVQNLKLHNAQIVSTGFDRPNLEFIVKRKTEVWADIGPYIENVKIGSVIVYCISRRVTEEIASVIGLHGILHGVYHAGISLKQRKKTHEDFIHDRIRVVVATIAFGMGINKPDVRLVVHYGVAKDVESYYQEVGRAGRDGLPAKCLMFYNERDWGLHRFIRQRKGLSSSNEQMENLLQAIRKYVSLTECRRRYILSYFGDDCSKLQLRSDCCDNCRRSVSCGSKPISLFNKYHGLNEDGLLDITDEAFKLLSIVRDMNARYGLGKAILVLRGSRSKSTPPDFQRHSLFGSLKQKSEKWLQAVGRALEQMEMLQIVQLAKPNTFHQTVRHPKCKVTMKACIWLTGVTKQEPIKIVPGEDFIRYLKPKVLGTPKILFTSMVKPTVILPSTSTAAIASSSSTVTTAAAQPTFSTALSDIYRPLLKVRSKLASLFDAMPYLVASTRALQQLAKIQPTTMEELRKIHLDGYSKEKTDRFGPVFLKVIRDYHLKFGRKKQPTSVEEFLVDKKEPHGVKSEQALEREILISQSIEQPSSVDQPLTVHPKPLKIKTEKVFEAPGSNEIIDLIADDSDEDSNTKPPAYSNGEAVITSNDEKVDENLQSSQDSVEIIEPIIELIEIESDIENAIFGDWSSDDDYTESSLSCAKVKIKEERVNINHQLDNENKELDLLIDALKSDDLNQKHKNMISHRVVKKSEIEYENETDSENDIFDGDWDLGVDDADLTQVSVEVEEQLKSPSKTIPPSDHPRLVTTNTENTDLNLFIDAVITDLNQNLGTQRDRKPRILERKASDIFQYEDDSASDSENERKPFVSPKKRVLPSWMQLSNKRKR